MRLVRHAPARAISSSTIALTFAVALAAAGGAPDRPVWLTGPALDAQLSSAVTVSWSNTPLARALGNMSAAQHIAIVLDRRVDPDQEISLALIQEPLRVVLQRIAQQLHAGYCQYGPVAYIGPPATAKQLRTLAALRLEEVRSLPQPAVRKLLQLRASHWDDLAEPRQLLDALAEEAGVKLLSAEEIAHDLWRAADLPQLSWIDRLTLLAAQFDRTFKIDPKGEHVTLVHVPAKVVLSRTYQAPRQAAELAKRWAEALPAARVTAEEDKVRLDGLLEDHEFVEHRLRGNPTHRTTVAPGTEVYQLSIENAALDKALEQLGQRLGLQLKWDRAAIDAASIAVDQLISVKVKDANLDELLRAILKDTGLTFRRNERAISIYPAESAQGAN